MLVLKEEKEHLGIAVPWLGSFERQKLVVQVHVHVRINMMSYCTRPSENRVTETKDRRIEKKEKSKKRLRYIKSIRS